MKYYVARSDGKSYGPFEVRIRAVRARADYHDCNEFRIVPVSDDVDPVEAREPIERVVPDPR